MCALISCFHYIATVFADCPAAFLFFQRKCINRLCPRSFTGHIAKKICFGRNFLKKSHTFCTSWYDGGVNQAPGGRVYRSPTRCLRSQRLASSAKCSRGSIPIRVSPPKRTGGCDQYEKSSGENVIKRLLTLKFLLVYTAHHHSRSTAKHPHPGDPLADRAKSATSSYDSSFSRMILEKCDR